MLKKVNAIILGLAVLLAVGCGKEDKQGNPDPQPVYSSCKVKKKISRDSEWSYSYDNKGNIILVNHPEGLKEIYEYNNLGKVSRLLVLIRPGDTSTIIDYEYNSDSLLIKRTDHHRFSPGTPSYIGKIESYTYDAQKRLVTSYLQLLDAGSPNFRNYKYKYTYLPNNKIRNEVYDQNANGTTWDLISDSEITFDNQKTPYGKNEVYFWLADHNLLSMVTTSYSGGVVTGTSTVTKSYSYNSAGYPTKIIDNTPGQNGATLNFEYDCQ